MLPELIYYLVVLLDQEGGGRHRAERVQNAEVPYIRYSIGWITKKVRLHQTHRETLLLTFYDDT